jgi:hypothetical protein
MRTSARAASSRFTVAANTTPRPSGVHAASITSPSFSSRPP